VVRSVGIGRSSHLSTRRRVLPVLCAEQGENREKGRERERGEKEREK
jgi:hypothetical protein